MAWLARVSWTKTRKIPANSLIFLQEYLFTLILLIFSTVSNLNCVKTMDFT